MGGGAKMLGLSGPVRPEDRDAVFSSSNPEAALRANASARATMGVPPMSVPAGYSVPMYGAYPPPPMYAAAPPRGLSVAGMVIGIVSVFFGLLLVLPLVGGILSLMGLRREPAGRGMAITGLVLNGLCLAGWVLLALMGFGLFGLLFAGAASSSVS